MSIEVIKINLPAGEVGIGGTFLLPYPTGMAAGSYLSTGAKLTDNAGNVYNATVSLGASGITVTNPTGRGLLQADVGYLQMSLDTVGPLDSSVDTPAAYWQLGPNGEVQGLLGPDGSLRGAPYRVFADISAPADTAENVLASFVIPGNSVPIGGLIRVTALIEHTNSANAKTYRMYIGGQSVLAVAASNNLNYQIQQNIYRRSATGVLGWPASNAYSSGTTIALNDRTVDMSVDQTFQFTGQKAAGAENITLKALILEVL